MIRPRSSRRCRALQNVAAATQSGLTLVELMISITLGLLVVMAATALLLSSKAGYTSQDEATRLQDTGRYAIDMLSRALRQTAYENLDSEQSPIIATADVGASIAGLDAMTLKKQTPALDASTTGVVNGSDVLAVRFFGSGEGAILNCAGLTVPAPTSSATVEDDRGWSIFYVAKDSAGEPELRCKYRGKTSWTSDAIARGVESFQVLYGLDADNDGLPDRFVTAAAINQLDDALVLTGANAAAKAIDKNRKTHWKKVMIVKVALLVRGSQRARADALTAQYDLFGKDYSDAHAAIDAGTRIEEKVLPAVSRNRVRKIFALTIQLRNYVGGGGA
jgi:type IV pilus assembly protein PilW